MQLAISLQVDNGNVGDSIASLGARGLFASTFNPVILDSWYLKEPTPLAYESLRLIPNDFALVLCTPWIWDNCHASLKYGILGDFTKTVVAKRKVALGLGSSYNLHRVGGQNLFDENTILGCRPYWEKYDRIICRDRLAYHMYSQMLPDRQVYLMPCPSFYIAQVFGFTATKEKDALLVFAEISEKTGKYIKPETRTEIMQYQDGLIKQGIDVLCITGQDRDAFFERYGREPAYAHYLPLDVVKCLMQYRKVVSARVHACMPSLSLGLDVDIIPVDSRALTAHNVGAKIVGTSLDQMERFAAPIETLTFEQACSFLRGVAAI